MALAMDPADTAARRELARCMARAGRFADAVALLLPLVSSAPAEVDLRLQLGAAYAGCRRLTEALAQFERALARAPDDPRALRFVAHLQQELGLDQEAQASFLRATAREPLFTIRARQAPPRFRVLLLFAPGAGNTPFEFLVEDAPFDCALLTLIPGAAFDAGVLRARVDLVVNLVADADLARGVLAMAGDLAARLALPLVNRPSRIAATGRAAIARRLARLPGCVVARTVRLPRGVLAQPGFDPAPLGLAWPLLLRPAGAHGGEHFELAASRRDVERLLGAAAASAWYASEFLDCRSPDGYVRKYRFFFVGGSILPYHLAIGSQWKVHHATTDMAEHPWMQREEREFLAAPDTTFDAPALAALRAIGRAVGLDYFGVDCALDRAGRVVVFEANACMLAHGRNERFPYKGAAVQAIRAAFQDMLEQKARGAHRR